MRETLQKAAKKLCRRLPNAIELGSLRQFSKLQPFGEKKRHPLECGLLGTLRQKQGLKREYIYYISITYSKAAKLGTLRWHPSRVGTLRKLGIFPRRLPNRRRLPSTLTPPHPSSKKFSRPAVALHVRDHPHAKHCRLQVTRGSGNRVRSSGRHTP